MGIIDRVQSFFRSNPEAKESAVAPMMARAQTPRAVYSADNLEAYSRFGYGRNGVVYRCISALGKGMGNVPWQLMRGYGKNMKEVEDDRHPLLDLLNKPNPRDGGSAFWEAVLAYYLLHGNAYIEGVSGNGSQSKPIELWTHRPDMMKIVPHPVIGNMPGKFVFEYGGLKTEWLTDPVDGSGPMLQWRSFNPLSMWYGQSTIKSAMRVVDQHNAAGDWNAALLQNGAAPMGAFKYAPANALSAKLTEQQRKQLQQEIEDRVAGPNNARRPLILDGGLDWVQMGMSPVDMDWLEGRKMNAVDICMVFAVPPEVAGISGEKKYDNYEQAKESLYEDGIMPLHDALCDMLNPWLTKLYGDDLTLRGNWDLVDALAPKREKVWARITAADFLTVNEKREAAGYDALEDDEANQLFVDAGKVPLGMATDVTTANHLTPEEGAVPTGEDNLDDDGKPKLDAQGKPIAKPVDGSGNVAPADNVQSAGLNGAQVTALQGMLDAVANEQMSPEAAVIAILLAFPTFDPDQVQEMVDAQDAFEVVQPEPPPGFGAPPGDAPPGKPAGPAGAAPGGKPPAAKPKPKPKKARRIEAFAEELKELGVTGDAESLARLAYGEDA